MAQFLIRLAEDSDNENLLGLCRIPVSGSIRLALEREPDYFAGASVQAETPEVYACLHRSGRFAGMFHVGYRTVFINRQPTPVRYFCDLRIHPDFQRSRLLFEMMVFCRASGIINDREFAQTIIFGDNLPMLNHLDLNRRSHIRPLAPLYHRVGEYHTYMIRLSSRPSATSPQAGSLVVRCATESDVTLMQTFLETEGPRYQGFPCYQFNKLGKSPYFRNLTIADYFLAFEQGQLVGMVGIWNQKAFKQTRICGYNPSLTWLRPAVNIVAKLAGGFPLPKAGSILTYFTLHTLLINEEKPYLLEALIREIRRVCSGQGFAYFLCSLAGNSPLTKACQPFRPFRLIKGQYFLVSGSHELPGSLFAEPYYLEGARI